MIALMIRIVLTAAGWYMAMGAGIVILAMVKKGEEVYYPRFLDLSVILNGLFFGAIYYLVIRLKKGSVSMIAEEDESGC